LSFRFEANIPVESYSGHLTKTIIVGTGAASAIKFKTDKHKPETAIQKNKTQIITDTIFGIYK